MRVNRIQDTQQQVSTANKFIVIYENNEGFFILDTTFYTLFIHFFILTFKLLYLFG